MNTTSLFVELIVIGAGVFVGIVLLLFAFVGVDLDQVDNSLLVGSAIPALAFIYVLCIICDRIADNLFDRFCRQALKQAYFQSDSEYYLARRNIILNSAPLAELLEYGRSRLRICRGWTINALLIGCALNLFAWRQGEAVPRAMEFSIAGSLVCLGVAIGSWYAWRNLAAVEYRKIRDQSRFLSSENGGDC